MNVALATSEFDPGAIDPRPCEWCGLTVDRHRMADHGEGPEHYCLDPDQLTLDELELRAELVRQIEVAAIVREMEMADPRDRWRHTGEPRPLPPEAHSGQMPQHGRPPQSTIDAFWFVVSLCDPAHLKAWLADHPRDTPHLLKLLEAK
jgi:hypothetical protein